MTTQNVDSLTLDQLLAGSGLAGNSTEPMVKQASQSQAPKVTSQVASDLEEHLTKQANEVSPTMSPSQKGHAMANQVMQLIKQAVDLGEMNAAGAAGNNVINETTSIAGMSTAGQQMQPLNGNPNQVLQATLAQALASGAVHPDQLDLNVLHQGMDEGNGQMPIQDMAGNYDMNAVPSAQAQDNIEKVAAVATLIDNGIDFEDAVIMVKQAEESILADEHEMIKRAAVNEMCQAGYSIEDAVYLVKQASAIDTAKNAGSMVGGMAKSVGGSIADAGRGAGQNIANAGRQAGGFIERGVGQIMNPRQSLSGFQAERARLMAGQEGVAAQEAFNPNLFQRLQGQQAREAVAGQEAIQGLTGFQAGLQAARPYAAGAAVGLGGLGTVGAAGYGINRAMSKEATVHAALAQGYTLDQALYMLG